MAPLRMAVIGVGHLGKEHARILSGLSEVELVGIADVNFDQASAVARRCGTHAYAEYWPLLNLVEAAVVVVPTAYHHSVATEFLKRGIPLLVEKPLATNLDQAAEMVRLAGQQNVVLQVGHIERFNPAFEELARRPLQPKFIQCERLGVFSGRSFDIGVVLDLMIHDIDLVLALVGSAITSVGALGISLFGKNEDVAHARLTFANGCVADLTASRASSVASRQMRIWSPEGYTCVDFAGRHLTLVQPSKELRDGSLDLGRLDAAKMTVFKQELFERYLPTLKVDCNTGDQLTKELQNFILAVRTGTSPRVSGEDGLRAIQVGSQILESLKAHAWEGRASGPRGPQDLPVPLGTLFQPMQKGGAAA